MARLTALCPNARADENNAHDLTDTMGMPDHEDPPIIYCRRCGQAITIADALANTASDPDRPLPR